MLYLLGLVVIAIQITRQKFVWLCFCKNLYWTICKLKSIEILFQYLYHCQKCIAKESGLEDAMKEYFQNYKY